MKSKVFLGILILAVIITGCAKSIEEIQAPEPADDIEQIPESILRGLCAEESWPPEGCSVIADPKGRELCEKCKTLDEAKKEEPEEGIPPSDITQVTSLDVLAADPSWNPDGSKIVFLGLDKSYTEGGLYVANSDGTGLAKIAGQWGRDHLFNPSWSPVSNKIIGHGQGNNGLFLVDLDGDTTKRVQITSQKAEHASWSPDEKKVAYNVYNEDKSLSSIWIMNSDGSEKTQLTTEEEGFCTAPSFSYDGSKIVYLKGFTSTLPGQKAKEEPNEMWVMNSDGSDKYMIYKPEEGMQMIRERAWNKKDEIIFTIEPYQRAPQIWIINSDGSNPKCIHKPESYGIPTAIYGDAVWDYSGTKVAVTKVILSDESWQIATFFLKK